jgi:hypothetical protein
MVEFGFDHARTHRQFPLERRSRGEFATGAAAIGFAAW